jgi:hypothetical protein
MPYACGVAIGRTALPPVKFAKKNTSPLSFNVLTRNVRSYVFGNNLFGQQTRERRLNAAPGGGEGQLCLLSGDRLRVINALSL